MKPLEEIAREASGKLAQCCACPESSIRTAILSALTEATQKSEAQVARLREALQHIDRVASMHTKGGMAQAQRMARAALSPKS